MEKNKISIMKQILNEKGSGNKMGILDRLKRGKRTSKEECSGVVSNAKKNSMTAVEYAKSFQKNFIPCICGIFIFTDAGVFVPF